MVKTIEIGGREIIFAANAATPYRYKQLFKEDLFVLFQSSSKKSEDENMVLAEVVMKLAFIMAKQAEKADMNHLSEDDFVEWLEGFAPMDLVIVSEEILNFYMSTTNGTLVPKKK